MNVNELQILGFGNSGINILNKIKSIYPNSFCIALIADKENLKSSTADKTILLNNEGSCCGGDFRLGMKYVQEKQQEILNSIDLSKTTVLVSALGGGCSSGSFLECFQLFSKCDIKFHTIISTPFSFEGDRRLELSISVISKLLKFKNSQNIHLLGTVEIQKRITLRNLFELADEKFIEQLERI